MSDLASAVQDFFYEYAACLDEERFAQWTEFFDPAACTYCVLSRENHDLGLPAPIMGCYSHGMVRDRVAMLVNETLTYRHMYLLRLVSNVRVRQEGHGLVRAAANLVVHQSSEEGVSSLYIVGRDRAELTEAEGVFRIRKLDVIVDSFGIDTMLAVPL
jgi:anthranilate 1,2-dioxygenase small subunit